MPRVEWQLSHATSILELTRAAVAAPSVPEAVAPMLRYLVQSTGAEGASYLEGSGARFCARADVGRLPQDWATAAVNAEGIDRDSRLLCRLAEIDHPLLFNNTSADPDVALFQELGVESLAVAPVRDGDANLMGAFLLFTYAPYTWLAREATLFATITGAMSTITVRLIAEERARAAQEDALRALGLALEYRDGETKGHTDRVTDLATRIGVALGLKDCDLTNLRWGAYLHDIGKISIPDTILRKPGKLDEVEWAVMRAHTITGYDFASQLSFLQAAVLELVRYHHERWDGRGYPEGLAGDTIPLGARIFADCDVYDALVSERPYKRAWSHDDAIFEITSQAGRQFDATIVDAFVQIIDDWRAGQA